MEYTHLPVDQDVVGIAGYYTPLKEGRLECNGREVLYVVGQAVIESSCCGVGNWRYVLVPGYVVEWQTKTNDAGLPVSEIEPISDKATQEEISRVISEAESVSQIEFW